MDNQHLMQTIDGLIERLSMPLGSDELAAGWSEPSQQAMLKFFVDLRERVANAEELPYLGIVRALDHWGVSGGELFRECANVDYGLRQQ